MVPHRGVLAPAFVAVYGGYTLFFGDIYSAEDLRFPDLLCARLAGTFVAGTQVGWFSLGGVVRGANVDTRCGMMGEESQWLSPKHDPEVLFLKKIATARASVREYLVHGRLGLPPKRVGSPVPTFSAPSAGGPIRNPGPFPKLSTAMWISPYGNSSVILFATPTHEEMRADYDLDPVEYVRCVSVHNVYNLEEVVADGDRTTRVMIGRYPIGMEKIPVRRVIPGRDVVVMRLSCATDSDVQMTQ